jgi:hypothetical protein
MTPRVTINEHAFDGALDQLGRDVGLAVERGVNRTAANVTTVIVRTCAQDLGLQQQYVRPMVSTQKAKGSVGRWSALIFASEKRIPLIAYKATGPVPSRGKPPGVTARFPGGRQVYPHAFITTVGAHTGVFERKGKARLPIRELRTVSVAHVVAKHQLEALAAAEQMLPVNFAHEIQFLQSQRVA